MGDSEAPDPEKFGYDPADFGADKIKGTPLGNEGYHWTAYCKSGGQISWNTDREGNYIDYSPDPRYGPEIHMSDRNVKDGSKGISVWHERNSPKGTMDAETQE
jgi:hypothetical protein